MLNIVPASSGLPADTRKERKAVRKKPAFLITRAPTRARRTAAGYVHLQSQVQCSCLTASVGWGRGGKRMSLAYSMVDDGLACFLEA